MKIEKKKRVITYIEILKKIHEKKKNYYCGERIDLQTLQQLGSVTHLLQVTQLKILRVESCPQVHDLLLLLCEQ